MARQEALIKETIRAMKLSMKRRPSDGSDSETEISVKTNRGNKLKRGAHAVQQDSLDDTGGLSYRKKVNHAGYSRYTISTKPPLLDDDGDVYSPTESDHEAERYGEPARDDPFAEVQLEQLLRPLTTPAELETHPSLSIPYKSKALTQMAEESLEMLRRERASLWKAKRLLQRLRGDSDWVNCETFETDYDRSLLPDSDQASVGDQSAVPSIITDQPMLELEPPPIQPLENGTSETEDAMDPQKQAPSEQQEQGEAMEGVETNDMAGEAEVAAISGQVQGPSDDEAAKEQESPADIPNGEGADLSVPTEGDPDRSAEENGSVTQAPNPAITDLAEREANSETASQSNGGSTHAMMTRRRARSPAERSDRTPSPSPSDSASAPVVHPWFIPPSSSLADRDIGLPAHEAEETRKLLFQYVQKQEQIVRSLESLHAGLQKADRLRHDVYRGCKAEGHLVPDGKGDMMTCVQKPTSIVSSTSTIHLSSVRHDHAMSSTIPFAEYLFRRLGQLNCKSVHGVPGDFMLRALDSLSSKARIQPGVPRWIGNANELCAGYAADGYARAAALARRNRIAAPRVGALFTTYGVGELSAINAVAGSYAESVPVVHMVGTPSRVQWQKSPGACIHHTLGDGRLHIYADMAKQITRAQADLSCADIDEAADRYDRALEQCVRHSKPVYVNLPSDVVSTMIPAKWLDETLNIDQTETTAFEEAELVSILADRLRAAKRPLIIADGLAYQFDMATEVNEIVELTSIPATCFAAGTGLIDESHASWTAPLGGSTEYSKTADLVLLFGPILSDTNTAAWSAVPDPKATISFNLDTVSIGDKVYHVESKSLLQSLIRQLKVENFTKHSVPARPTTSAPSTSPSSSISQDSFWSRISSWLRSNDTVLLANGTPLIGGRDMSLPDSVQVIASGIWCSIGHMLPAAQGVAAAKRDLNIPGRTILFEGDGSFQVTCQSISDIIQYKLDVTIFMCNNAGYTYERLLHGLDAEYNDVPSWRYTEAASFMGGRSDDPDYPILSRRAKTWGQLEEILQDEQIADGKGLKMIDVAMEPEDVPIAARKGLKKAGDALRAM
ncbi:Pyruvate decarboxylase [Pseudocercospora fuligena]|uniref:Pyruvate decarboxylase n=1 Tax=Pseudocercospora fuligena TaxID=685502 RepID=A0A8H6RP97_9PEZI|nr:Pyruvate decarboxylase [Pseudocercospora fuligena]